ncbi:MAG: hypothetical protein MJ158_03175 [Alphaproteobacteria bacterium]|nr:hypothetical protein [Alphaproteobacteria bacterium]
MKKFLFTILCVFYCFNAFSAATLINDTEIETKITQIIQPIANAANIPQN